MCIISVAATVLSTPSVVCSQGFKEAFLEALSSDVSSHYQAPSEYSSQSGYYPYSPPPVGVDQTARNQHAYDVGYRVGQDDFHHHLNKHFPRHAQLFDSSTHDAFGSGYETGYDRARSEASRPARYTPPKAHGEYVESPHYPSGYYPYSPTPKNAGLQSRIRHAADVGFRVGQDDFNHGRSKHFVRHEKLYDAETKDSFKHSYESGYDRARGQSGHQQRSNEGDSTIRVSIGQQKITITEGGNTVSTLRTASPNVEKYHFASGQNQIVVKSRGNHGPATVELFDVKTGTLRDKVLAFAIKGGQPEWARGMED